MSDQSKTAGKQPAHLAAIPCCPPLPPLDVCDKLDFFYRLNHDVSVAVRGRQRNTIVPVEVKLHFRLTRCRGPMALGDLSYTTTLLPGEDVKLFTSDLRIIPPSKVCARHRASQLTKCKAARTQKVNPTIILNPRRASSRIRTSAMPSRSCFIKSTKRKP